jgi:hypothetical protein
MWLVLCCNAMATVKDDQPPFESSRPSSLKETMGQVSSPDSCSRSKGFQGFSGCFTSLHEKNWSITVLTCESAI